MYKEWRKVELTILIIGCQTHVILPTEYFHSFFTTNGNFWIYASFLSDMLTARATLAKQLIREMAFTSGMLKRLTIVTWKRR